MILGLEIKRATLEDTETIHKITLDAFDRYVRKSRITSTIDALKESAEDVAYDITHSDVFIAYMFGKPAGSIRIVKEEDGKTRITRFGVTSEYRRIGIGHELMKKVDEIMQTTHVKSAYLYTSLSNSRLIHFYKRHGYFLESVESTGDYPRAKLVKNYF